jgi:hypothetical protein
MASTARSLTLVGLYSSNTRLEQLAQDLEDMVRALRQLIQPQDAVVREGHLPRHGPLAAADHAHSGDRLGGSEGARDDDGGAPTDQAGDRRTGPF